MFVTTKSRAPHRMSDMISQGMTYFKSLPPSKKHV